MLSDELPGAERPDVRLLPRRLYLLHRAAMRAARRERELRLSREDLDESGRAWPGLVKPPNPKESA